MPSSAMSSSDPLLPRCTPCFAAACIALPKRPSRKSGNQQWAQFDLCTLVPHLNQHSQCMCCTGWALHHARKPRSLPQYRQTCTHASTETQTAHAHAHAHADADAHAHAHAQTITPTTKCTVERTNEQASKQTSNQAIKPLQARRLLHTLQMFTCIIYIYIYSFV